jgi:hypothetical protein
MIAPLSRIAARYLSGALVTYGLISPADAAALQPEFVIIAGALIGAATEAVYALAVKKGWTK